jgi:plasmid stability protein
MAQVIIRNLDDKVVNALKRKAKLHCRSLEQELREILTKVTLADRGALLTEIDRIRAMTPPGIQTDSTDLVREDRDNR